MNRHLIPVMSRTAAIVPAALLMLLASLASQAAETFPANAVASRYGAGWECVSGFQRMGDRCPRVVVPANA